VTDGVAQPPVRTGRLCGAGGRTVDPNFKAVLFQNFVETDPVYPRPQIPLHEGPKVVSPQEWEAARRGDEQMGSTWNYLDITALGRQEEWEDTEFYGQTHARGGARRHAKRLLLIGNALASH
jgi:hypothetical protein